jgi:hypothetical protein
VQESASSAYIESIRESRDSNRASKVETVKPEKVNFLGEFSFKKPTKLSNTFTSSMAYKFSKEDAFVEDDEY